MPLDLIENKSALIQVMAWFHQPTSCLLPLSMLNCWPRFMSPYGVSRPQWVNSHTQKSTEKEIHSKFVLIKENALKSLRLKDAYASVNYAIIGSGNGLSPVQWSNAELLSIVVAFEIVICKGQPFIQVTMCHVLLSYFPPSWSEALATVHSTALGRYGNNLTHWPLGVGDLNKILDKYFSS